MALSHPYLFLSNIALCVYIYIYHIFCIHSSVLVHLSCFPIFAVVPSAAVIVGMKVYFTILVFSGSVPRYGIAGSLGTSVFSFLKNLHNVLPSGCTHLHSHPWWEGFLLSTLSSEFIVVDFLRCSFWLMWHLIGQLTSLSLRTSDFRIFSSTLWPSLCLLWSKVHLDLWPIFLWECFLILSFTSYLYVWR